MAKTFALRAGALLIGCFVLAGCGQGASGNKPSGFNGAPPELKADLGHSRGSGQNQ